MKFKKDDLENGMIIELRDGTLGLVIKDLTVSSSESLHDHVIYLNNKDAGFDYLSTWNDDLRVTDFSVYNSNKNVAKVYELPAYDFACLVSNRLPTEDLKKHLKLARNFKTVTIRGKEYTKDELSDLQQEVHAAMEEF